MTKNGSQSVISIHERYSQRNTVFYSVQYKNGCLAASDVFHMFTQSIKLYTFHYHVLKSTDVCKRRSVKDSKTVKQ